MLLPPLLTSRLIPGRHGFSMRAGGVSSGPYASLNLGTSTGDSPERVAENLGRLARAAEVLPGRLNTVSQVHGDRVLQVPRGLGGGEGAPPPPLGEADALWTDLPGIAVAVRSADCVPLLLSDEEGRRVLAVHSGWKGTALRIAERAVQTLKAEGVPPASLRAAIGPSIRLCCYLVSEEVAARFRVGFGERIVVDEDGKVHLDLARAVRWTLVATGMREEQIELLPDCTSCDPARFFSHRRDQGATGRHLAFIVSQ